MASRVFFNGRLLTTPTTATKVNDDAMAPRGLNIGNTLALIGQSDGGQPNHIYEFGDPQEAAAVLVDGELLRAVQMAFDASAETNSPGTIAVIRVGTSTQAALILKDGAAADVITLTSEQYGLIANQTKVKVEAGTTAGKKLTTQIGNDYYSKDDVARSLATIQYAGTGTGTLTTTNSTLTLTLNSIATPIALASYPTVGKLVDKLNTISGITAAVLGGMTDQPTVNALDTVTAGDIKTSLYTVKADLQAVVDWFNSIGEGFVTAARVAGAGTVPTNLAFTYLAGGTDPAVQVSDWTDALTTLQTYDAQWVAVLTGTAAIHAALDAHAAFMSSVGQKERRAFVGPAAGTSLAAGKLLPAALNSDRTALIGQGHYDYDATGALVLYPPYMTAAKVAGGFAGLDPGEAMTNKTLKIRGLEYVPRNPTDTDDMIQAGMLPIESTPQGFKVVRSVSTWLVNDKYNRVEVSCGRATDYAARTVRERVDRVRGQGNDPRTLGRALHEAEAALRDLSVPKPDGPGILVGDANSPPWRNLQGSLTGDTIAIQVEMSPVIPNNFNLITIATVPYSGTASA